MPSKSKAQYKLFEIASYNKEFAEKRHMDQKVAREWHEEDKKKRKEDPEWYDNLPEKAEDKEDKDDKKKKTDGKKKHRKGDESMESIFTDVMSSVKSFFAGKPAERDGKIKSDTKWSIVSEAEKILADMYLNKDWLDKAEFHGTMIKTSDVGPLLRFPSWPSNILDGIEKGINELEKFLIDYSKTYTTFMDKMKPVYEKAIKMEDLLEGEKYFLEEWKKNCKPMDNLKIPTGTLGNFALKSKDLRHSLVSNPQSGPANIKALDKGGAEKAAKLMQRIFGILDDQQDRTEWWGPDAMEDHKEIGADDLDDLQDIAFFNITGLMDNAYDPSTYWYDTPVEKVLVDTVVALDKMIDRSVK